MMMSMTHAMLHCKVPDSETACSDEMQMMHEHGNPRQRQRQRQIETATATATATATVTETDRHRHRSTQTDTDLPEELAGADEGRRVLELPGTPNTDQFLTARSNG
eukprot:2772882-Rhodomonas_salina.4